MPSLPSQWQWLWHWRPLIHPLPPAVDAVEHIAVFIGVDGGSLPSLAAGFTLAFAGVQHLRISKEDNNSNPEAAAREVVTGVLSEREGDS